LNDKKSSKTDKATTKTPQELRKLDLTPEKLRDDGSGKPERRWRTRQTPTSG